MSYQWGKSISGRSTKNGLTKLDFNNDGTDNWTQFMRLVPVGDCLTISVTLIAKTEGLKQHDADRRVPKSASGVQMKSGGRPAGRPAVT
jgi:hypothetical protein